MLEELFCAHRAELTAYCRGLCRSDAAAQDMVQEVFLRAWQNIGTLQDLGPSQRRAWLYRTARNLFVDAMRRTAREAAALPELEPEPETPDPDFAEAEARRLLELLTPAEQEKMRLRDHERLKQMTFYCRTRRCLRQYILNYFGEKAPVCCGHCGNCDTNFEEVDATMDARKILSCVYRLDERRLHFGKTVVAAVLTGSKIEQIGRFSLHTLSTYGIMSEQTAVRVRQLIDVLLERGLLTADPERYNALFLTKTGNALMRGRGELHIRLPREKKPETVRRTEELSADVDEKLFEKLRALRTKVAQRAGVPPYVVFSNATLADMAARQPKSEYELLGVRGVGEAKARRYGAEFVDCIRDYLEEN